MIFTGLKPSTTLKIYTLSGKLVHELQGDSQITWDGKNQDKESIAQGLYIYVLTDEEGNKKTGKIAVK